MNDDFINVDNVYQVALTLLNVDIDFIKPECQENLHAYITELKKSIDLYEHALTIDFEKLWINRMRDYLKQLLKDTQHVFNALDDKGKTLLQNYIALKQKNNPLT